MARNWIRQDVQIASTTTTATGYVDNVAPSLANYQTNAATITDDLNNLRSQVHNLLNVQTSNWYADINTPGTFENGAQRGVNDVNQDLHDLERKRVLVENYVLTDITVPSEVKATGTLTGSANFSDTETVTIGTKVYTFQTTLTNVDGNVQIGGDLQTSLANLKAAINLEAGAGTLYAAATTLHPTVEATASDATTLSARAKLGGTQGNLIATTETAANASWGAATLTGGAGDVAVLTLGQLPTNTTAAIGSVTTLGTVAAYNAGFPNISLAEVSGTTAISPKNLSLIVDADTRDPILSGGRVIYALFQTESNTDGSTMTGTTPNRAMLSFVRINAAGDDLEIVPSSDIAGKDINYSTKTRKALEDLTEQDFLKGAEIDVPSAATVTRQVAYDNQGTTPVDLTTNATLDLEGAGLIWAIRDDLQANLFRIIEGSAGGTSEIEFGTDVDLFDNNAAVNDFSAGATLNSGGTRPIAVGVTDGVIESTAGDLRVNGTGELYLDDGNQTGSTWAQTAGIKLSDTTAEWDLFETTFGEVSLLNAITQAYTSQVRTRVQATLTSNVTAGNDVNGPSYANNTDVDLAPFNLVTFTTDVDVYLNGELLRNASGATEDVYPGTSQSQGDLKFTFNLLGKGSKPDQITVIVYGQ